jgi:hypothetical protein
MNPEPFDYFIQPSMYTLPELAVELWWFLHSIDELAADNIAEDCEEMFGEAADIDLVDGETISWVTDDIIDAINDAPIVRNSEYCFTSFDDLYAFEKVED